MGYRVVEFYGRFAVMEETEADALMAILRAIGRPRAKPTPPNTGTENGNDG